MIFFSKDTVGGLQIQTVDGAWTEAPPMPGTILLNVGDLLEIMSAGKFPATPHRVLIPEDKEEDRRGVRQSIAFFLQPDDNIVCRPISEKKDSSETLDYNPIRVGDYLRKRVQQTLKHY